MLIHVVNALQLNCKDNVRTLGLSNSDKYMHWICQDLFVPEIINQSGVDDYLPKSLAEW